MSAAAPLDLRRPPADPRVQHLLMLRERTDKTARNGKPYAILKLGNATGEITANAWEEHLPDLQGVVAGTVLQVIGEFELREGKRQLKLTRITALPPGHLSRDEILAQFVPRITQDPQQLWDKIDGWCAAMPTTLRAAVESVFRDDAFRVQFAEAPGATRGHHAMVGGLLLHTCEVAEIARASVAAMQGDVHLVTAGALLHDIGKVQSYSVDVSGFDYTPAGHLLGHIVLGSLMLQQRLATLPPQTLTADQRLELHHFIQSHHGIPEYGAAARPMTLEAELLHHADQASAKGNDFTEAVTDPDLFPTDDLSFSAKRSWRLERRVWKRAHGWE